MTTSAASELGLTSSTVGIDATKIDPWSLSPEQAQTALDGMKKQGPAPPANSPAAARMRLAGLHNDQEWLGKYFAGSPAAAKELGDLLERSGSDRTERLLAGAVDPLRSDIVAGVSGRETADEFHRLRQAGIDDDSIRQLMQGEPISEQEYRVLEEYQRQLLGNAEWVKLFLSGDHEAARQMTLVKIAMLNGYKSEAS